MAPTVKELEKHLKYCNLLQCLKIMVLKRPKLNIEEHPKGLKKNILNSAHYNSLSTTQRPWQTSCIIPKTQTEYNQISKLA